MLAFPFSQPRDSSHKTVFQPCSVSRSLNKFLSQSKPTPPHHHSLPPSPQFFSPQYVAYTLHSLTFHPFLAKTCKLSFLSFCLLTISFLLFASFRFFTISSKYAHCDEQLSTSITFPA